MSTRDAIVVHYHEVGLKKGNRPLFERALVRNITAATADLGDIRPRRLPGRYLVPIPDGVAPEAVSERLARVFGIANHSIARIGRLDFEQIAAVATDVMAEASFETFAVRARISSGKFPLSAREINEKLGAHLLERTGARVNLSNPDRTCRVEIVGDLVAIYADKHVGPGGLPVGTAGRVSVLLSAGIDSPVAALRMMRRGAICSLIHFHSQPFTDGSSVRNAREVAAVLRLFQHEATLHVVPLAPSQQAIVASCPEGLRTILYRRMMMRIATELARRDRSKALVTGDALGQVASQTLENLGVVGEVAGLPVLRPLIGMDKLEIIDEARAYGTYEISSAPAQEACVLFEPKRPATKARSRELEVAERDLDIAAMVADAVEQTETID